MYIALRQLRTFLPVAACLLTSVSAVAGTTTTTLAITASGTPVASIPSGKAITLTATVLSSGAPVTPGQVKFCDATATYCTDVHLLGTAQLTSAGTAAFRFVPGPGSRAFKAIFAGTKTAATSASATASLTVSGGLPSATSVVASGSTLTATVSGSALSAPTGTVSMIDATYGGITLGTADLVADTAISLPIVKSLASSPIQSEIPGTGDFNNDGITDIAVSAYDNSVYFLLNDGKGGFTPSDSRALGTPRHMVSGDFNNDGNLDMAVTDNSNNAVAIFLGDGTGKFTAGSTPATGNAPYAITTADFDGDGNADLAVENFGDDTVTILLGNGSGGFSPVSATLPTDSEVFGITTGDFNGDGKPDLAILQSDALNIFLGNGDGTFHALATVPLSDDGIGFAVADLNGDGKADLAIMQFSSVTLLQGNGDGTFTPWQPWVWPTGASVNSFTIADFNGDGIPDLGVLDWNYELSEGYGKGDGTFPQSASSTSLFPVGGNSAIPFTDPNPEPIPQMLPGYFYNDGHAEIAAMDFTRGYGVTTVQAIASSTATATGIVLPHNSGGQKVMAHYAGDADFSASAGSAYDGPFVALSATSLTFPAIYTGDVSAYKAITVTNIGNQALNISKIQITNTADFYSWGIRLNNCGSSLPSGSSCQFSVVFRPTHAGPITAKVSLDDTGQWLKQQIALTGTGR
jgi:hypothetical protein